MIIMQEDLLSEIHLPKLDLTSLQNVLSPNSTRLPYLIKENDYVKNGKALPPHFRGKAESVVRQSGFPELDLILSVPGEHAKAAKRRFVCNKSLLRKNYYLINDLKKSLSATEKCGLQESHIKHNEDIKSGENEKSQGKCSSYFQTPISESKPGNKSPVNESIAQSEVEILIDDDSPEEVKNKEQSTSNGFSKFSEKFSPEEGLNGKSKSPAIEVICESPKDKKCDTVSHVENGAEPALCVISEVVGNANETFSKADQTQEKAQETKETQLITPKKTTDITKIKGWRRKQFFVEKPTTVEYYSISKGSQKRKRRIEIIENSPVEPEDPGNVENAFVCDSLDEFLDREAELKISYEIPHLYAEFGIKLTSDDIVSRPNLSEEDIKEVGTRYCVPVTLPCDGTNLEDIKEETYKRLKRPSEEDTKQCKVLKLEENKRLSVRSEQKPVEKCRNVKVEKEEEEEEEEEEKKNLLVPESVKTSESKDLNSWNNTKLMSKLIALVVYPSPFVPLHPIVQYHIDKLRSYHTKVDKNWADFAASAVLVNDKRCRRKILPVRCCVRTEKTPHVTSGEDNQSEVDSVSLVSSDTENAVSHPEKVRLKKCSVVIERLDSQKVRDTWCMEHNCYNCSDCGLAKVKPSKSTSAQEETKNQSQESMETVIVSPRASFDKNVASLLAKKVRLLKYNGDTLTSIDCLKTLIPNTIEFIKLKFVKESFMTGYINIWFLKPSSSSTRSRAFLTFSQTPPVPEAINLKSTAVSQISLPKVITEIVSPENSLDSNEYAILHCNGRIWEIHGSLNITFGNSDKKVEQIFTSVELPELKKLQDIAYDILKVKSVKWWVLDLTQKFRFVELKSGSSNVVISRKKFLKTINLNLFGFIPLRKDVENRVLGAYIIRKLLPFILIGPYYLLETHDMILKGNSSDIPFRYFGEDNVTTNCPLKFFINSVIKNLVRNDRRPEGLWLYDKMCLDSTSYLEVVTTSSKGLHASKFSTIDIDHGYSLNSLTSSSLSGATSGIVKRKDGRVELKKVTVYLYFDIFDLGFVEGELQFDNSVIINHPLDWRTKMKSHKVGDLFIGVIKGRLEFFPKDLAVRWFITKHKEDLRCRNPFNNLFLSGTHILTRKGVFCLLEMPEWKIEKLGLDKSEINKAIAKRRAIKEVRELKGLAGLLGTENLGSPLNIRQILARAIVEIEKLKKMQRLFRMTRDKAFKRKVTLACAFVRSLNSSKMRFHVKLKKVEKIVQMFKQEGRDLPEDFIRRLNSIRIGRRYLKRLEKLEETKARREEEKMSKMKSDKLLSSPVVSPSSNHIGSPTYNSPSSTAPNVKVINVPDDLYGIRRNAGEAQDVLPLQCVSPDTKPNSSFHFSCPRILKPTSILKKLEERNVESRIIKTEPVTSNSESKAAKPDGFLTLTSPDLPDNIKLFWRNWNVSKMEVV